MKLSAANFVPAKSPAKTIPNDKEKKKPTTDEDDAFDINKVLA
jgi:hypothetical protein